MSPKRGLTGLRVLYNQARLGRDKGSPEGKGFGPIASISRSGGFTKKYMENINPIDARVMCRDCLHPRRALSKIGFSSSVRIAWGL